MRRRWVTLALLVVAATACGGQDDEAKSDGTWVGTITTEGDVTTVMNESGSVWGGEVGLEETLSIGSETGGEPYLFGEVQTLAATQDRIYVVDRQLAMVRVYAMSGGHLFDIGREGEGPGEFSQPQTIGIDPDDRVLVLDRRRLTIFDLNGTLIETWPYRGAARRLVMAIDGTVFLPWSRAEGGERSSGYIAVAPDGTKVREVAGATYGYSGPWNLRAEHGGIATGAPVRYAPGAPYAMLPTGAFVHGTSDAYRFEIEHSGGERTVIGRTNQLVPIPDAHRNWLTRYSTARMRSVQPDWSWNVNPVPEHKPAFAQFFGDRYGRIWVHRIIGTEEIEGCDLNPSSFDGSFQRECWRDMRGFDVFEEESGRFLGQVPEPAGAPTNPWPTLLKDGFLMPVEDDAGTIMVKRYRLVLPGEDRQ